MSGEIIGLKGVKIPDLQETTEVRDSNYMILVDEETGRTYKVKRERVKAQKTSELVDDVGFLRAIPGEYITKSEVKELTDAEIAQVREFTNAEIAQVKELTDGEIAQIREVLNTWEAFKNNGGKINGDIEIEKHLANLKIGDGFNIKTHDQKTELSSDWNKAIVLAVRSNASDTASYVRLNNVNFAGNGNMSLGEGDLPWTDIYLNGMSKSSNGYTKLPNGFIIQWGHAYLSNDLGTGLICTSLSFPIQFPGDICHVYLTPCVNQYAIDGEYSSSWERPPVVYKITPSEFEFAFNRNLGHFGSEIKWFAIGY